jgi:hypothetical protein
MRLVLLNEIANARGWWTHLLFLFVPCGMKLACSAGPAKPIMLLIEGDAHGMLLPQLDAAAIGVAAEAKCVR